MRERARMAALSVLAISLAIAALARRPPPAPRADPPPGAVQRAAAEHKAAAPTQASALAAGQTLDINRATQADLQLLPGIGPTLAERIIEHRERVEGFTSVTDLKAVSGIGPATLERIRSLVHVRTSKSRTRGATPASPSPKAGRASAP